MTSERRVSYKSIYKSESKNVTVIVTVVIFGTDQKHSKFGSWTSENKNCRKSRRFPNLKLLLCVYITFFLTMYQVCKEQFALNTFFRFCKMG